MALYARNERTRTGLAKAAERAGMSVIRLTEEPSSLVAAAADPAVVVRAPGGLVARAISLGARIRLAGPTPATHLWLDIDSEYRVFTRGRDTLTVSPYRVQDEPWTPLLRTHRASFHAEAADYVQQFLAGLPADGVPPAAVVDVARLTNGRLVVLEANQCWGAGLYGCDPDEALPAILAANAPAAPGPGDRWLWRPDPALAST